MTSAVSEFSARIVDPNAFWVTLVVIVSVAFVIRVLARNRPDRRSWLVASTVAIALAVATAVGIMAIAVISIWSAVNGD